MCELLKSSQSGFFFLLCLLITVQACSEAEDYKGIQNIPVFNKAEITQIIRFQKQFEEEICTEKNLSKEEIQECYILFYKKLKEEVNSKKVDNYQGQEFYTQLLDILDQGLKSDFFSENTLIINRRIPNSNHAQKFLDTIDYFGVNSKGRLFKYIEAELVDQNSYMKQYFDDFNDIGDLSPFSYMSWIINYEQLDFEDDRFRLFLIIHYLSMVDSHVKVEASKKELLDDISKAFERRRSKE